MSEVNSSDVTRIKGTIKDQYQTIQQLPARTKSAVALVGAFLLVSVIFVFMPNDDSDIPSPSPLSTDKASKVLPSNKDSTLKHKGIPLKKVAMHDIEKAAKSLIDVEVINTIKKKSDQNTQQIASVSKELKELQTILNPIPVENKQHGVEIQNIHAQLASLKSTQQKLQEVLPQKITHQKRKRKYRSRPPFKLVSIDLWGNDASIIVRQNSQLHDLSIGQVLGKWQVESIDMKRSKVVFSNQRGVKRTLHIET